MKMGKHCFCQKPLTRTIWEARLMADVAREKKVCTQMGNQGTAYLDPAARGGACRGQVVGKVSQVHVWTDRPNWPSSRAKSADVGAGAADVRLGPVDRSGPHASLHSPGLPSLCPGAASGTSAAGPWATWPAIRRTCPTWAWT